MTSVAVIWSAVASIESLKKDLPEKSSRWPKQAEEMLNDLKAMKELLLSTNTVEQNIITKVVRLSYEIVDAIADSLKPSTSSRIMDQLARASGGMNLQYLHKKLKALLEILQANKLAETGNNASSPSKANVPPLERKNSGRGRNTYNPFKAKKKLNKPDSTTGSESKRGNVAAESKNNAVVFDLVKEELRAPPKDNCREVYIVGESGMGKSTVARKLYNDPDIRKSFDGFGWVTMDRNFRIKGVLQLLLKQLRGPGQEEELDLSEMNEIELIALIFDVIKEDRSYLLVLDDIGDVEDWNSIRPALPRSNSTRVIITSSSTNFASRPHHYTVSGLTQQEILTLLEKEASFEAGSEEVGKAIYEISGGSPLYAMILGKSIKSEAKDEQLVKELRSYESKKGTPQVLEACYKRLAPRLKPCLLYLGQFPSGQDIQFEKLYLLLAAEKLILPPQDQESEVSRKSLRDCLNELARLNLVQVEEDTLSRSEIYKSCRIHKQVGEFCKSMGSYEEFFQVVEKNQQVVEKNQQVVDSDTRRLAISYGGGSSIRFEGNDDTEKNISSLLIFDTLEAEVPWEINDLEEFSRLRILSFDEVNFKRRKLPKGIGKLQLLRLLSFRGCILESIPSSLRKLTQLETLDLLVRDECKVSISGNIFAGMDRMVHLFLPSCLYRENGEKQKLTLQGMKMLETLVNFNTDIFEYEYLSQRKTLRNLSTITNGENSNEMNGVVNLLNTLGKQLQHSSMEIRSFDCYDDDCVSALGKLLRCEFVHSVRIEGQIGLLPDEGDDGECAERSVALAEMVLSGSELEDDPMGYFGMFQNLRSLELADDAYIGAEILISPSLFQNLRSLKLRNLMELEKVTIEEGALPQLSSLQIENCGDALKLTIPEELYQRLKNESRDDAYSVVPSPSKFKKTPISESQNLDGVKEADCGGSKSSNY